MWKKNVSKEVRFVKVQMIWDCMSTRGLADLEFIEGTVKAVNIRRFCQVLVNYVELTAFYFPTR